MSKCNCSSLSCGRVNAAASCHNHCGCVASDGTPACNAWAPWGRPGCGQNGCGCSRCSRCGRDDCTSCTCGAWSGCSTGSSGYLLPRYVSIGRTFQRQMTQTLCADDIPDFAESPLTLVGVTVSGQAAWEQISECRQQLLRVTVPVALQIRDCSGRCRTGHATVTLTIPLCGCSHHDLWRGQLYVAPCIRLAAPVTENDDGCFDAPLEVSAEVYLVRLVATSSTSNC